MGNVSPVVLDLNILAPFVISLQDLHLAFEHLKAPLVFDVSLFRVFLC